MKTLIAIPCMDQVAAPFAQSLATLDKAGDCVVSMLIGSLIYDSRNKLAAQALRLGVDYVLWLDSDVTFPPDTISRLKAHLDAGADVATGLYFRRAAPYSPVISKTLNLETGDHANYDDYPEDRPFEVEGCGFGCVLVKAQMLLDVGAKYGAPFSPLGGAGEDLSFCWRVRQLGGKIVCDPSVSCGHVSHTIITADFWNQIKALDAPRA